MAGMGDDSWTVRAVGHVSSELSDPRVAPRQGDEGAPQAWITLAAEVREAAAGICAGDRLVVLTWLHLARRDVLRVHPRGDLGVPEQGVFSTRSPDRPNPIGLHPVRVLGVDGARV